MQIGERVRIDTRHGKGRKGKEIQMDVTISNKTAERLLRRMADWLEYIDGFDKETRADILALDELTNAMHNGQDILDQIQEEQRAEYRRLVAENQARKEAKKND